MAPSQTAPPGAYPRTLKAVRKAESAPWGVVDALQAEVVTDARGHAKAGELGRVAAYLTKYGTGDTYKASYLKHLLSVGRWAAASTSEVRAELGRHPLRLVMVCQREGKLSPEQALARLEDAPAGGWSLRDLAEALDAPWSDRATSLAEATPEQLGQELVARAPEAPEEVLSAGGEASRAAGQAISDRISEGVPEDTPELGDPQMQLVGEVVKHLAKARGQLRKALRLLEDVEPSEYARELLAVLGQDMVAFAEAVHAFSERGTTDWDEAFTALLNNDREERRR